MKRSMSGFTKGTVTNLSGREEKTVGKRSELLHVDHKVILDEEVVGKVTQPAVQDQNVKRKMPGQPSSSKQGTPSQWLDCAAI